MSTPTAEEIVEGLRKMARSQALTIIKRLDSKTFEEVLGLICPVPEHLAINRMFLQEMLDEGLIKTTSRGKLMITEKGNEATSGIPDEPPRMLTREESETRFIKRLIDIAKYWHENEQKSEWEKMEGMLFSILVLFDGGSCDEPGFDIVACVDDDAIDYAKDNGLDWYSPEMPINGAAMHERFHSIVKSMRPEEHKS